MCRWHFRSCGYPSRSAWDYWCTGRGGQPLVRIVRQAGVKRSELRWSQSPPKVRSGWSPSESFENEWGRSPCQWSRCNVVSIILSEATITNFYTHTNPARMGCVDALRLSRIIWMSCTLSFLLNWRIRRVLSSGKFFLKKKSPFFLDMDFHCQIERLT